MPKYQVIVKWMEIHEIEVEAESEEEAYDIAVDESTNEPACDCSLYDVEVNEIYEEEEEEE